MTPSLRSGKGAEAPASRRGSVTSSESDNSPSLEETIRILRAENLRLQNEREESTRRFQLKEQKSARQITALLAANQSGSRPTHITPPEEQPQTSYSPQQNRPEESAVKDNQQIPSTSVQFVHENEEFFENTLPPNNAKEKKRLTQEWVNNQPDLPDTMALITAAITDAIRSTRGEGSPRNTTYEEDSRMTALIARQSNAKELPMFYGDPLDWPTFKSQFDQSTETCGLTLAENLIRLQRALRGRAKEAVFCLLVEPRNVPEILQTLELRFGHPEAIVATMLERVRRLPKLQENAATEEIVEYSVTIRNVVATVEGMQEKYLASPQLLNEMVAKLPLSARLMWFGSRIGGPRNATISDLSRWLMEISNVTPYAGGLDPQIYCRIQKTRRENTVFTHQSTANSEKREQCPLCNQTHRLFMCPDFLKKNINERWEFVKERKICYLCLNGTHKSRMCHNQRKCGVDKCQILHHKILHNASRTRYVAGTNTDSSNAAAVTRASDIVMNTYDNGQPVLLKIVPITISGPRDKIETYALLDEGSTISLIDAGIADALGARGPRQGIKIHGASGMCSTDDESRSVKIKVKASPTSNEYSIRVNTMNNLDLPIQPFLQNKRDKGRAHAEQVKVYPRLLIGQDNAHLIVTRELRECNGYITSLTALGWTTHGKINNNNEIAHTATVMNTMIKTETIQDKQMDDLIRQHFAIDALGVSSTPRENAEDVRVKRIMKESTRLLDTGHWETGLLWKNDHTWLPENKKCALSRLLANERKMRKDENFERAYKAKMKEYIEKGYARKITTKEATAPGKSWYLPHFAVLNPNKPGKIRIVFDAASQCKGISLNNVLHTGPALLSSLLGNIFRFREGRIAVAADIKEMFLQVKIKREDQKVQLFLWRENHLEEPQTYVMTSMIFGATCSPSSAQYVRNKIAESQEKEFPAAAEAIKKKFYMDDYLDSMNSEEEAIKIAREVGQVLLKGGFELTNWASNSPLVMQTIPTERWSTSAIEIFGNLTTTERVLGIRWNPASDEFTFKFLNNIETNKWPTKREMLSAVMQTFDPVGFLSCLLIRSKILLQEVWRSNIGWDDKVRPEHQEKWKNWITLMKRCELKIPRCCVKNKQSNITLHVFCDASELACCAVAYFVEQFENGELKSSFISSKCKVSPLRALSIPRLELQAALMAARLAATIRAESNCKIQRTIYWTDSSTVLCWLRNDPRTYSVFVAHRLGEIDELTDIAAWKWVPTKENPADAGTRDGEPPELSPEGAWFKGPKFITRRDDHWPKEKQIKPDEALLEVKFKFVAASTNNSINALPDINRFSSWTRLIRATGWMLRFIKKCRNITDKLPNELSTEELNKAEQLWVKASQAESFGEDVETLKRGEKPATSSRLHPLTPMLDAEGIIRMDTRLQRSNSQAITQNMIAPIILDGAQTYTRLLIKYYHIKGNHCSSERTLNDLRCSLFILRVRTNTRHIINKCQTCKHLKCRSQTPLMGQLPEGRLCHNNKPFTHCGIDFFGPLQVTIGRRREKRYGVLFTCLTTRAVHLELAGSLSSDSAILAIRRMSARRGHPTAFYSDNATNFHGADKEMREAIQYLTKNSKLHDELTKNRIEWNFIPPASPHMGGAWERLVRSVKKALNAVLREQSPREETLITALAEAEFSVNSRPLTHVSVDPRDEEALTPNHFLIGSAGTRPHLAFYKKEDDEICLRKQWRVAQKLADMFWRRWLKEYLPTLAQRPKWQTQANPIKEGDLVLIKDPNTPRNSWPKGIITEATPAADGQVRSVRVKTATGEYVRPAVKIIVLNP